MLNKEDYRRGWEWKREWYSNHGFNEGINLFTTTEGPGLDMTDVMRVAEQVKRAVLS